jgi:SAM-dependent methyltransferase
LIDRFRIAITGGTLFLSAFLLFVCQPMVGKMLLPYLGGAAAVWSTCVLFFQFMLLLGYVYAHLLARVRNVRKQMLGHAFVLLLPLAFLPIRFNLVSTESISQHPAAQLFLLLATSTAIPFFVVSATAPLVQNWFSQSRHESSGDPYFLYAASNAGSLLALMAYPFVIEPRIGVGTQSHFWSIGYSALLVLLILTVAALYERRGAVREAQARQRAAPIIDRPYSTKSPIELKARLYWLAAAFVPSGLMLAVTNHIAENVGSVPFLWIVPLALYLLTFIVAFARRFHVSSTRVSRLIPVVLLAVFPLVAAGVVAPPGLNWIVIGLHLLLLYCGALLCHTRLAESRPDPEHLTEFYFWIALGGVLGGVFTATLSPLLFDTVLEYPLLVAVLPFFRTGRDERPNYTIPIGLAAALSLTWLVFRYTHLDSDTEAVALVHTTLLFIGYKLKDHVRRFAWSFVVFIMAYSFILPGYIEGANRIYVTRNFFGVKKVLDDPTAHLRKLLHGDTIHGTESTDAARAGQPLSYYYPGGSVSDVIEMMRGRQKPQRFGVLGLGSGTMAAYGDRLHHVRFYEIDPSVEPIARRFFTFVPRCGTDCDVVIGDGRLQLAREPNASFDLLLLDAFSSDSVPTHLLSNDALRMYLSKLVPDGIVMFHVSNRYLNVEKLVSSLVMDAGLVAYSRFDDAGELRKLGKSSANHIVAARNAEDLSAIAGRPGWNRVTRPADFQAWTDDYSNLLSLIRWH